MIGPFLLSAILLKKSLLTSKPKDATKVGHKRSKYQMNEIKSSKVYTDNVRYEYVFVDRPFGYCFFNEVTASTKWVHCETFGM